MLSLVSAACGGVALIGGGVLARLRRPPAPAPTAGALVTNDTFHDANGLGPLEAMLDLVPHPLAALDGDGMLLHANRFARVRFGDALASLLRHPLLLEAVRRLVPDTTAEIDIVMDVPVRRVLRIALHAAAADIGIPVLILLSLTDRTEQEAALRMRTDFVANASHELRTPLASLIGFIETLQGPAADDAPARIRFLGIMAGQTVRMRRLIDNMLSLSRIQMHEHERPTGCVAPASLLSRVAEEHEPSLRAAGGTLTLEIAEGLGELAADFDQLAQVLHNLLDNALKYGVRPGQAGRFVLSARVARAGVDPSPDGVVLSVADDGPGIAARHIPRLTERFYRAEEGKAGSGLGLAIVKHIVGRHGGRLLIESLPGEGARFSVWLPVASRKP